MTVTRTPLCTVKYCPAPSDPDWHHCLVTGSNVIEHHHVEGRGKTRTMDKKKVVPLAVPIHKKISMHEYGDAILDLDGSKLYRIFGLHNETIHEGVHPWMQDDPVLSDGAEARLEGEALRAPGSKESAGGEPGRCVVSAPSPSAGEKEASDESASVDVLGSDAGPRGTVPRDSSLPLTHEQRVASALNPLTEDWADLPDDQLQALYESAEQRQGLSFLVKCKAVHTFKEKHNWGDSWPEHAYQRFGASRRTLYAYANIWAICVASDTFIPEKMAPLTDSKSLMQSIGRRSLEDGKAAMEAAVAHYAEFGEAPTVAALAQRLGVESGERVSVKRWSAEEIAQERLAWHASHPEEHSELDCGPCGYTNDLLVWMEGR